MIIIMSGHNRKVSTSMTMMCHSHCVVAALIVGLATAACVVVIAAVLVVLVYRRG